MLDSFDRRIIAALQEDARMTVAQIAERVSLSATPVSRRLRKLEEDGVITGYSPRLDAKKLGFPLDAYITINLQAHSDEIIDRFEGEIKTNPYVIACHAVTGEMDYLLRVVVEDMGHYSRFVMETLLKHPSVEDCKTSFVLDRVKATTVVPV